MMLEGIQLITIKKKNGNAKLIFALSYFSSVFQTYVNDYLISLQLMKIQRKFFKPDIKKYEKNYLYRRQTNILISENQKKSYLIDLFFLGDINKSLIEVFLHFFQNIHEISSPPWNISNQKPLQFNKIFIYFAKLYFIVDKFLPPLHKTSQQQITAQLQIVGNVKIDYLTHDELRRSIRILTVQIKQDMLAKVDAAFTKKSRYFKNNGSVLDKLRIIEDICLQEKQKVLEEIINIQDEKIKSIYVPKEMDGLAKTYVENILNNLKSIKFTRNLYKSLKFKDFILRYKNYYKIYFVKSINRSYEKEQKSFIMQRYTNNNNQYLIDIYNLVKIRNNQVKYEKQLFQTSKQLLKELVRHQTLTKSPYPLLSPKSVIFNQLSLKVQLSYHNPLLQGLGLLKMPANLENTVCFKATPQPYDTYATYYELLNPDFLTNHLIGASQLLQNHYKNLKVKIDKSLEKVRKSEVQKSQCWRFMMTIYFIMTGREYYTGQEGNSKFKKLTEFKEFIREEQQKLYNSEQYFLQLLSKKFTSLLPSKNLTQKYIPKLQFFENLLNSAETDSIIQQFSKVKLRKFLKLFGSIMRQLISLSECRIINKIYNTIRYLLRFYLGMFLELSLIMIICEYSLFNSEICLLLFAEYNMKQKKGEDKNSYIQTSFHKFTEYSERQKKEPQDQITYLSKEYKDEYNSITKYYQFFKQIKLKISSAQETRSHKIFNEDMNQWLRDIINLLKLNIDELKEIIVQILGRQFLISKPFEKNIQKKIYYRNKLELLTSIFLGLNSTSVSTIQTIIIPFIQMNEDYSRNHSQKLNQSFQYKDKNEICLNNLEIIRDYFQFPIDRIKSNFNIFKNNFKESQEYSLPNKQKYKIRIDESQK